MIGLLPGPLMRSSGGTSEMSPDLLAQPRVGERLDGIDDVEVGGVGDPLEQRDRRKAAGHQPESGAPVELDEREALGLHEPPPRTASRYWRTWNRSATRPPSMRASALSPPNSGALFGLRIQASARSATGNSTCNAE